MANKLGILAGGGPLPARLIAHCRRVGREFFVLAFEGQTEPALVEGVPHGWTRLGAAEHALELLRSAAVRDVVMAGAMRRPSLVELRPDARAARVFARIGLRALGDDGILGAVRSELEAEGFRLVGVDEILGDLVAPPGVYTRAQPDAQARADMRYGFSVIEQLGPLDIGQAVVVQAGVVLGVEAAEGTDALIERCASLLKPGGGGVLVKNVKPGQDRRADLPTIGPLTVARAAAAGLAGIAVGAGSTLVLEREEVVTEADRRGLFVTAEGADAGPLFYLIAGEPSGDMLGAALMRALRQRTGGTARFAGIGGEQMAAEGLESAIPIAGLAIMGVLEVVPAARRVFRWVRETVQAIERLHPAAVVTIDSSGFCFRVAERLRKSSASRPPIFHYVAPMVWAWRPYRAKHAARAVDHLLTLLPFEPPYFTKVGLPATFVGHPVVESGADRGDGAAFRSRHGIPPEAPIIAVLPGSRRSEVRRLLPVFGAAVERLASRYPELIVVIPTVETVVGIVEQGVAAWRTRAVVVRGVTEKRDAFAASAAALAASGTVTLELAVADVPMVVGYRIWAPTAWVLRRAVRVPYATLLNIIAGRAAVPELLQDSCTPEALEAELARLLDDPAAREAQRAAFRTVLNQLGREGPSPSLRAADCVLELAAARNPRIA